MSSSLPRTLIVALIFPLICFISCTSPRKVVYFNNLTDTSLQKKNGVGDSLSRLIYSGKADFETPIQKNDQLWITVGGQNLQDLMVINSADGMPSGGSPGQSVSNSSMLGYFVESDGKIKLPFLGAVQAEGLTRKQLENFLSEALKDYTKEPVVNVRFINYYVSVLGEVAKPGKFPMQTERMTVLDAISLAGDLTDMGKRENVLVIREVNGERSFARLNLLSKDIFTSPYFYLKTNDVVYIEPVKAKFITRTGVPQYIGIAAVGISLLITIINVSK
jgi:polysaccharide export outer membrane protein